MVRLGGAFPVMKGGAMFHVKHLYQDDNKPGLNSKHKIIRSRVTERRNGVVICNCTEEAAYKILAYYEDTIEGIQRKIDHTRNKDPQNLTGEHQLADIFFKWLERRFNDVE